MILVKNLNKKFNSKIIFDNVDISFPMGLTRVHGYNGSGKTTLLQIISGAMNPDDGDIYFDNLKLDRHNAINIKNSLGYVPDNNPIFSFMTGEIFLNFISSIKNCAIPLTLLEMLNLNSQLKHCFSNMSYGTKKKFMLVAALCGNPKYLIMDEPFNGLDETAITNFKIILTDFLANHSHTCILATHEDKFLCDIHNHTKLDMNTLTT